jgi:hypothetical protein
MQVEARQAHVPGLPGHVQSAQDEPEPVGMLGLNLGDLPGGEEEFEALVPEPADRHVASVTPLFSGYKVKSMRAKVLVRPRLRSW